MKFLLVTLLILLALIVLAPHILTWIFQRFVRKMGDNMQQMSDDFQDSMRQQQTSQQTHSTQSPHRTIGDDEGTYIDFEDIPNKQADSLNEKAE